MVELVEFPICGEICQKLLKSDSSSKAYQFWIHPLFRVTMNFTRQSLISINCWHNSANFTSRTTLVCDIRIKLISKQLSHFKIQNFLPFELNDYLDPKIERTNHLNQDQLENERPSYRFFIWANDTVRVCEFLLCWNILK